MPTEFNFKVNRKTDVDFKVTLQDSAGAALNLSRVAFTAKKGRADADAAASIKLDSHSSGGSPQTSEIEITDAATGKATIKLSATKTDIEPGKYHYDVKAKTVTDGKIHLPGFGTLEVLDTLTDRDPQG